MSQSRRLITRPIAAVVLLAVGIATSLDAQDSTLSPTGKPVPAADMADVATIDGILTALYDVISGPAGQARNWDRFRSLHLPEARLIPTGFPPNADRARARVMTVERYVETAAAQLEANGFFEREIGRIVERFGNIAHVFSTYDSRLTPDGEVFQRGINSIQLLWDGGRWWIVTIFWRGVGPEAAIPARYLRAGSQ